MCVLVIGLEGGAWFKYSNMCLLSDKLPSGIHRCFAGLETDRSLLVHRGS